MLRNEKVKLVGLDSRYNANPVDHGRGLVWSIVVYGVLPIHDDRPPLREGLKSGGDIGRRVYLEQGVLE